MNRRGGAAALTVGLALVAAAATGRSGFFVRPWFAPVLLATGCLVVLTAVRRPIILSRPGGLLLLAPVAVGLTLTPGVVGGISGGAADAQTVTNRIGDPANPLLSGHGGDVTLLQILSAEQQVGSVVLAGRPVTLEARVTGPRTLSRSVIVCCAADARSLSVPVRGAALPSANAWVRVTGRLDASGGRTVLVVARVTPIPTPADPFL